MKPASQPVKAIDTVRLYWGDSAPAWISKLAHACDAGSQSSVAKRIGRSPSLINQVLKNQYKGSLDNVQGRVEAVLQTACHECPVLGKITGDLCLKNQSLPYNPGNHVAVRLFLSCRRCPHNLSKKGGNHAE